MEARYSQRVSVECGVVFAGDHTIGEGRTLDLSLPGCLLQSATPLIAGDYVQLRLFLPDFETPLHVPLAAVRWVDGSRVGVEFIRTSQEEQRRLKQFVQQRMRRNATATWTEGLAVIDGMQS
ncbi:MAG: PilZ domain-containing protein [Nitrospiraceae bacterium]|nr:PilZ domain-containing protein [Nitrospiraceae bacterium]